MINIVVGLYRVSKEFMLNFGSTFFPLTVYGNFYVLPVNFCVTKVTV